MREKEGVEVMFGKKKYLVFNGCRYLHVDSDTYEYIERLKTVAANACNERDYVTKMLNDLKPVMESGKLEPAVSKDCQDCAYITYQLEAMRTAPDSPNASERLLNGLMGLCGEAGEALDILKKVRFQGHPMNREHLAKELGDVAWYLAVSADALGYSLEEVLEMNIAKLCARYPHGFDSDLSINRKEGDI